MKRYMAFLLAVLLCGAILLLPLSAQTNINNPSVAAMQTAINTHLGKDTPGAAVLLYDGGARVMMEGFGYADVENRVLTTAETAFELGQLSGIFVALSVGRLVQEGRLDLTQNIANYLPEKFMSKLSLAYKVTLADLLAGKAGFEGRTFDVTLSKDSYRFKNLEKALLADIPAQVAAPGTYYAYSEFGLTLAAYVVETVSGMEYSSFVEEKILRPLGMTATALNPDDETPFTAPAKGHTLTGEGSFAAGERNGRRYGGLYPANGAISTVADLSLLVEFLLDDTVHTEVLSPYNRILVLESIYENGIFFVGNAGMVADGAVRILRGETPYFGSALAFDRAAGKAALVLTNASGSELLDVPAVLCGAKGGIAIEESAENTEKLKELKTFSGVYGIATQERSSFVGRLITKDNNQKATVEDDGTLSFLGMRLRQVAPCVFAKADDTANVAVLQFLLDEEGEVSAVLTASGETYLPLSLPEWEIVSTFLFFLLIAGTVYFLVGGLFLTVRWIVLTARGEGYEQPWQFTFPWTFAGLLALLTLLQIWIATAFGASAVPSFFRVMSTISLFLSIGGIISFLISFVISFTEREETSRMARAVSIYIIYLFVCYFWQVILV